LMGCIQARETKSPEQGPALKEKTDAAVPARVAEVLLVEDSPISQTVLTEMLRKLGHHVDSVGTGKDAIARCATKEYDLVLMDIQMPEIDGLEATIQIRRNEQPTNRHQTIVALTAHAMPSDRVRCQEVGMDGFLVKPIAFDLLKHAIDTVLGVATSNTSTVLFATERISRAGNGTATPGNEPAVVVDAALASKAEPVEEISLDPPPLLSNADQLQLILQRSPTAEELASMFSGNTSLLREVLSLLIRELPRLRKLYETSLENGNCAEARRAVHTLKSNVRYVGLYGIAEYAEQIERIARDGNLQQLQKESSMLSMVFDHVANWADTMLRKK
jgi:two-component system, sensor histidine kinase and response regulator